MKKQLHICLIMQGSRNWIGGTEYTKNIILALASLPVELRKTIELSLLCSESVDPDTFQQIEPHLDNIFYFERDLKPNTIVNRILWKLQKVFFKAHEPRYNRFFKKEKFDFIYPYVDSGKKKTSYQTAAWLPDFQHKFLPDLFSKKEIKDRDIRFNQVAQNSSQIILSSKTAQADFQKFYPQAAYKSNVLFFRSFAPAALFDLNPEEVKQKYHLPDRFFLVSNQFWQHKNHLTLFKAVKILKEKSVFPVIICTGHIYDTRNPAYSDKIFSSIHEYGIGQQISLLGLIPKADQLQLLRASLAVIQPSLFEGWSTIVEDARSFGKSIIISDLAVHLEQNPPNSFSFERNSPEDLATILADLWGRLSPGPDLERERIARENSQKAMIQFGHDFLEIARTFQN